MPTNQLQERLDSMLDWLVEERFLRRLGVDETYEARRQDKVIDEDETWDDDVPVWVNVAQESGGVTLREQRKPNLLRHPMARLPWGSFQPRPQQRRRLE